MKAKEAKGPIHKSSSPVKRLTFGSLLILMLMLLYIPSLLLWLAGSVVSSDILRIGTIEESIGVTGLIVRNEELVKPPPFDGRYVAEICEGEKAPAFAGIATVLNKQSESLLQQEEAINAKIVKAQMEKAEKTDFFSEDIEKLDEEIGLKVQELINACNNGSFGNIRQSRHEIELIVEKKAEIIGENSTDKYIDSLKKQKEAILNKLNRNTARITASTSGIVSYAIDGLEQVLGPAAIEKLTPERLDGILAKCGSDNESDGMAHAGKPLVKIIKGTDIYIVAAERTESLNRLKKGDGVLLRFKGNNLETRGTVDYIGKPVGGRSIISIKTNRGADVLSTVRKADVDIIIRTEEGLKAPLSCLRNFSKDGKTAYIMIINRENVAERRKVEIVCRDKDFAIVRTPEGETKATVSLYNSYILYPDRVKEGEIVQK